MIKKNTIRIPIVAFLFSIGFLASQAYAAPNLSNAFQADTPGTPFASVVDKTDYEKTADDPFIIIGDVIATILSILGVLFVFLMVYGGYLWMTAAGNETQLTKAKGLIQDAVIGLIIMAGAYAISYFVTKALVSPFAPGPKSQAPKVEQPATAQPLPVNITNL